MGNTRLILKRRTKKGNQKWCTEETKKRKNHITLRYIYSHLQIVFENNNNSNNKQVKDSGITIIGLIVTIIVLLTMAGVGIGFLSR